jgi:hypothetical protein
MLTPFVLLALASGLFRLALSAWLSRRYGLRLAVPQLLAGALVVLAGLPEMLRPLPWPLPLSVTLGVLLPDLLFRRG